MTKKPDSVDDAGMREMFKRDYPLVTEGCMKAVGGVDARIAASALADMLRRVVMLMYSDNAMVATVMREAVDVAIVPIGRERPDVDAMKAQSGAPYINDGGAWMARHGGTGVFEPGQSSKGAQPGGADEEARRYAATMEVQRALEGYELEIGIAACMDATSWYLACMTETEEAAGEALDDLVDHYKDFLARNFDAMKAEYVRLHGEALANLTKGAEGDPAQLLNIAPAGEA